MVTKIKAEPRMGSVWSEGFAQASSPDNIHEGSAAIVKIRTDVVGGGVVGSAYVVLDGARFAVNDVQAAALAKALVETLIVRQRIDANPDMALDAEYLGVAPSTAASFASRLMMGSTIPELEEGE